MDKITLLKSVFVFSGLEETVLNQMSKLLREAHFTAGQPVFNEGDKADAFYIIEEGEILISKKIGSGKQKTLSMLGAGSVFGEMAFFSDSPRIADAASKTDSMLWKIERIDFMSFIADQSQAGLKILSGLLQVSMNRLEHTSKELATIYQTGKIISSGLNLNTILKDIQEELTTAIPEADGSAVFLYNEFNLEYSPAVSSIELRDLSIHDKLLTQLKTDQSGILINNMLNYGMKIEWLPSNIISLMITPMLKSDKLEGFIVLWSTKQSNIFKNSYKLLIAAVAGQLAEAIENIRHQQEERDRKRLNSAREQY